MLTSKLTAATFPVLQLLSLRLSLWLASGANRMSLTISVGKQTRNNAAYAVMIIAVVAPLCVLTTQTPLFLNTCNQCSETRLSVL